MHNSVGVRRGRWWRGRWCRGVVRTGNRTGARALCGSAIATAATGGGGSCVDRAYHRVCRRDVAAYNAGRRATWRWLPPGNGWERRATTWAGGGGLQRGPRSYRVYESFGSSAAAAAHSEPLAPGRFACFQSRRSFRFARARRPAGGGLTPWREDAGEGGGHGAGGGRSHRCVVARDARCYRKKKLKGDSCFEFEKFTGLSVHTQPRCWVQDRTESAVRTRHVTYVARPGEGEVGGGHRGGT